MILSISKSYTFYINILDELIFLFSSNEIPFIPSLDVRIPWWG